MALEMVSSSPRGRPHVLAMSPRGAESPLHRQLRDCVRQPRIGAFQGQRSQERQNCPLARQALLPVSLGLCSSPVYRFTAKTTALPRPEVSQVGFLGIKRAEHPYTGTVSLTEQGKNAKKPNKSSSRKMLFIYNLCFIRKYSASSWETFLQEAPPPAFPTVSPG